MKKEKEKIIVQYEELCSWKLNAEIGLYKKNIISMRYLLASSAVFGMEPF